MAHIDIVFDGPPSAESGRFIEVEDENGKSIGVGDWIKRANGHWALRLPTPPLYSEFFYECDGPPCAYTELTGPHGDTLRLTYETVLIYGPSEEACRDKFRDLLMVAYQPDLTVQPEHDRRTQFLIWRRRPTTQLEPTMMGDHVVKQKGVVVLYARLWISNFTFQSLQPKDEMDRFVWKLE